MNLYESLRTALTAIGSNKMRSVLTMLGIIIGVAAVIALASVGKGVEAMVSDTIGSLGSNMLIVMGQRTDDGAIGQLTTADARSLDNTVNLPSVTAVAATATGTFRVTHGSESADLSVVGTNANYDEIRNLTSAMGSFLAAADLEDRAKVAVLGWGAYTDVFADSEYPLEQIISIDGTRYRVIGVLEEKGSVGAMGSEDDTIYVPLTTGLGRLFHRRDLSGNYIVSAIYASVIDEAQTDAATQQITSALRNTHRLDTDDQDDFQIISQQQILDISSEITGVLTTFLAAIAGISLLVGGIGIMNIMLVTVTERTREIGVRKAVGATSGAIATQFLIESLTLTLFGGVVGILLGSVATNLLGRVMDLASTSVTVDVVLLSAGVAGLIGVLFGVYPALRAARLHPIEALRYE
jgi:putative ABC transport system permease protein